MYKFSNYDNTNPRKLHFGTAHVMCKQTVLHVQKNSCTALIPLCKNTLNLPMCSSFFLPYAWLPAPLVHHVVMLATSLHCADYFCLFVFTETNFVAQP